MCAQWKTPDDGQRNCPKHVEFYFKNKFEKIMHIVAFIVRIFHDERSPDGHILSHNCCCIYKEAVNGLKLSSG